MTEHFAGPPDWLWYILFYFFLAGLSGGSYLIATLLRLRGDPDDEPMARVGFYVALPPMLIAPILLTLDLGQPWRFWHMLWNTTPDAQGLNFMYWSPMSIGVWAVVLFGAITTVSFVDTLARDGKPGFRLPGWFMRMLNVVGAAVGLFVAGYTGVLLSVSNQPVWSDTWALGGLFLASGLSGSAALLLLLTRLRPSARASFGMVSVSSRLYALLELALLVAFVVTLFAAGTQALTFGWPWLLLWLVALAALVPGLYDLATERLSVSGGGVAVWNSLVVPLLVLAGVLALRAAVIFSVQV